MQARIELTRHADAVSPLYALGRFLRNSDLEPRLVELVLLRVSQINGCAYCIDRHSKDALAGGEDPQRLHLLPAWRDAPQFSERERVGLAWAEAVTRLGRDDVDDLLFERALDVFGEGNLVALNAAVVLINAWNRIAIPFAAVAGDYQPAAAA